MTAKQSGGSYDYLKELDVQQLYDLIQAEIHAGKVNDELLCQASAVLASKQEPEIPETPETLDEFLAGYMEGGPLFEAGEPGETQAEAPVPPVRIRPFRRLIRVGIAAVLAIALLLSGTAVASAMGYAFWDELVTWTRNLFGFSTVASDEDRAVFSSTLVEEAGDPLFRVRSKLEELDIDDNIVPRYVPEGYEINDFLSFDTFEGINITCSIHNGQKEIVLNYIITEENPVGQYTKDEGDPESYRAGNVEHYILLNEGEYAAVWINGHVLCRITGVESRPQLLDMLNSIYEE